jgi:hypothetical protein
MRWDEELLHLLKRHQEGETKKELADELKISYSHLCAKLRFAELILCNSKLRLWDNQYKAQMAYDNRITYSHNLIEVKEIEHSSQRYDTYGDWQFDADGRLNIKVSKTRNEWDSYLLAIHEIIEAVLCRYAGITEEEVDKWDLDHPYSDDPGAISGCPYASQHSIAFAVEKMLADKIKRNWREYEKELESLIYKK